MIGIYKITNKINGKAYIGQSIDIENRWKQHIYNANYPKSGSYNYPINCALRKYGKENFTFETIEECDVKELNEKEIYWIKYYQTFPIPSGKGYNAWPGGDGNYFRLNEEQVREVINELRDGQLYNIIADKHSVCRDIISYINRGVKGYRLEGFTYPIIDAKHRPKKPKIFTTDKYLTKQKKNKGIPCPICGGLMKNNSKMCSDCYKKTMRIPMPTKQELLQIFDNYNREEVANHYKVSGNLIRKWCHKLNIDCQNKKALKLLYRQEILKLDLDKHLGQNKPKCIKIAQLDPDTGKIIKIYESIAAAGRAMGCSGRNLIMACDKPNRTAMGYKWSLKLTNNE